MAFSKKVSAEIKETQMKRCTRCGVLKSVNDYYKRSNRTGNMQTFCKICSNENARNVSFKKWYNLTNLDYDRMLEEQNGRCMICGRHQSEFKNRFNVDHDHTTGKVRALLCVSCNTGLGKFRDNVEIMNKAIEYLKNYK